MRGPFFRASSSPVLTTGQLAFPTASNPVLAHPHFQQALLRPQPALTSCPRWEPGGAGPKGQELRLLPSHAAGCCTARAGSTQRTGTGAVSCHTQAGIVGRGWGVGQQLEAAAADMSDPMGAPREPSVGGPAAVGHGGHGSPPCQAVSTQDGTTLTASPGAHLPAPGAKLGDLGTEKGLFENTAHKYLGTCY